jgi:hypothetical protein
MFQLGTVDYHRVQYLILVWYNDPGVARPKISPQSLSDAEAQRMALMKISNLGRIHKRVIRALLGSA